MNIYHLDDIPEDLQQYFQPAPQLGLEKTPEEYVAKMVEVFMEVRRVLRVDGTLWLNLGDSYAGSGKGNNPTGKQGSNTGSQFDSGDLAGYVPQGLKPKDLVGIPWQVALALQASGWYLRQDIIWAKPNPMPESVTDRCTKSHEYIFLLSKSAHYFYDNEAVKEPAKDWGTRDRENLRGGTTDPKLKHHGLENCNNSGTGRNLRSVWTITTKPFREAHFATFPPEIPEICIKAGTSEAGCCSKCGAPVERVVEKTTRARGDSFGKKDVGCFDHGQAGHKYQQIVDSKTIGWKLSCECRATTTRCVVLDPFSGAGTTAMMAKKLGRNYIGIELNPEYVEMSERRIEREVGTLI